MIKYDVAYNTISSPIKVKSKESLLSLINDQKALITQSKFSIEDLDKDVLYTTRSKWLANFTNLYFPDLSRYDYIHFYDGFQSIKRKMLTISFWILGAACILTLIIGTHFHTLNLSNSSNYFSQSTVWWIYIILIIQLTVGIVFWRYFKNNPSIDKMKEVCKNTKTYYRNLEQLETIIKSMTDSEVDKILSKM